MSAAWPDSAVSPGAPQSFRGLISMVTARADYGSSRLVDAHHQCRYADIPAHLHGIQTYVSALSTAAGDCIAVELSNGVAGALLVLALLDAGYGVVLTPGRDSGRIDVATPHFCAWTLAVRTETDARRAALDDPSVYLTARRNDAFSRTESAEQFAGCVIARSSGSLSVPKLVVHRSECVIATAFHVLERLQLNSTHRLALPVPIFHLYGLGGGFLPAFCAGASIDFLENANVLTYLAHERRFEPNTALLTPTFCDFLLQVRRAPRRYEFIVCSGDRLTERAFDRMEELHGPVLNSYGCTEMGSIATASLEMSREMRRITVGSPYAGIRCRIVERADDDRARSGFGELQLQSANAFHGYVDADGRFIDMPAAYDDGWFRTGDYSTLNAGAVEILGRCDLSVNRNGVLLPLADIEHRLREISGVRQAAVAVGEESIRGRRLIAFCVPEEGVRTSGPELRRYYAGSVPAYAVPDEFRIVDALPVLPNGKLDRRALATVAQQIGNEA